MTIVAMPVLRTLSLGTSKYLSYGCCYNLQLTVFFLNAYGKFPGDGKALLKGVSSWWQGAASSRLFTLPLIYMLIKVGMLDDGL